MEKCPASRSRELYRICLFLGVALRRMGFSQSAIKSWISCQRLNKRGHTRKMLARLTNSYGMERKANALEDDWQAFSSIQTARYLMGKNKRTFSTMAEKDMISDLIHDHWVALLSSEDLRGRSSCDKLSYFRKVSIVFPGAGCPRDGMDCPGHRCELPDPKEGGAGGAVPLRLRVAFRFVLRAHPRKRGASDWYILIHNILLSPDLCHIDPLLGFHNRSEK